MSEYETCLICGIKRGFNLYPDCRREAEKWEIKLAKQLDKFKLGEHIWRIVIDTKIDLSAWR